MTRAHPEALLIAPLLLFTSSGAAAQDAPPRWELAAEPSVEIGLGDVELHRVRAAASLSDDRIVVADGGNTRILVLSPEGELIRAFGSQGDGPEEFRSLSDLAATTGDTLVAYDGQAGRTSVWLPDGTHVSSSRLPQLEGQPVWFVGALSPSAYLGTRYEPAGTAGLSLSRTPLLKVDPSSGDLETLESWDWRHTYMYAAEGGAVTGYDTPFLGQALFVAVDGSIGVVPLGASTFLALDADGSTRAEVPLPVPQRPFDRRRMEAHRDSLLELTDERFPFAAEQLREVFGDEFPAPEHAPAIEEAVAVGDEVWLKVVPEFGEANARWYVVDPDEGRLVAQMQLPSRWQVLGGDRDGLLILRRTELDVEVLGVYPVGEGSE